MNKPQPQKRNLPRSILATFQYLFLPGQDPSYLYWSLGAITVIGIVIRLWKNVQPIGYDEAYTFVHYASRGLTNILADYSAPNNHIFHTLLVRLAYEIFGRQVWIVRLPAFLAGTLCIPAAYFAARRISTALQSLAAAALIALTPWFVSYSTNGRGYALIVLFSLLLMNLGALLIQEQRRTTLAAYAMIAALGFYTIPIFLYPMAGISLWVLATHLTAAESWKEKSIRVRDFLLACLLAGLLTLLLYLPVILFGTGFDSIVSNDIVESRQWTAFVENLQPRALKTWESWMQGIPPSIEQFLLTGFLLSLLFYRKASRQRLPLQIMLVLGAAVVLAIQRVAPLARVWLYLEGFYLLFAAIGWVWLAEVLLDRLVKPEFTARIISTVILVLVGVVLTGVYVETRKGALTPNQDDFPEQHVAEYLASHLGAEDTIVSLAPVDIQTAYYLYMYGVPYQVFYQRDHPVEIQNAVVVLRTNLKYNTPEAVLEFYKLSDRFDLASTRLLFEYGPVQVFSIPAR